MTTWIKDPAAELDFSADIRPWLRTGDTIANVTWSAPGLSIGTGAKAPSVADGIATVWLSGGTAGTTVDVVCRVTTTQGRTDERTQRLLILER